MRTIQLPARCDRAATEALLPEFLAAQGGGVLSIDASETRQIGQGMLQLLVSARRSGDGAHITPSAALIETARLTGLGNILFDGSEA
ncbi:MAG TPA: STAS domain-containing protein [Novosphingobium sp.]|nr:STAS domain-containing protein [Novosphingobium sp.]